MCNICEKVKPNMNKSEIEETLDLYSAFILKNEECSTIDTAIGVLLDVTMAPRDEYEESHWEEDYRNRDEN